MLLTRSWSIGEIVRMNLELDLLNAGFVSIGDSFDELY